MYKQHIIFKVAAGVLMASCLSSSAMAKSKQSALLDASGQPLSMETLELLSSASSRIKPKSSVLRKISRSKSPRKRSKRGLNSSLLRANVVAKKQPPASTPALEMELFEALKAGKIPRVKVLLKKGVKPRFRDVNGTSPLKIAVTKGWASMVVELIEHGANIDEKGRQGLTLLHVATSRGLIDVAKVLVKSGIHPSTRTDTGWTPLHVAARYGHWQLVQYYLQLGVDPNSKNIQGRTALGLATNLRHMGVVKILSRVTSARSLDQVRMSNLRDLRESNTRKRLNKLEQLKEFRRMRMDLKRSKNK